MRMTFNTPQGSVEDNFESDQPLRALKAAVLARLNLPSEWVDQYIVACEGQTLEEEKSLKELGLAESSTLVVWRVSGSQATRARP